MLHLFWFGQSMMLEKYGEGKKYWLYDQLFSFSYDSLHCLYILLFYFPIAHNCHLKSGKQNYAGSFRKTAFFFYRESPLSKIILLSLYHMYQYIQHKLKKKRGEKEGRKSLKTNHFFSIRMRSKNQDMLLIEICQ